MSEKTKTILSIISLIVVLPLYTAAIIGIVIWYNFFDTGKLVFYDKSDGTIEQVYPFNDQLHLVSDSDKLYISGGNKLSSSREYLNAELRRNEELGIPQPVLIFEGKIKQLLPYDNIRALIITEENELFSFEKFEVSKIADNVISADRSFRGMPIYYTDASLSLHCVLDGIDTIIGDGIKSVGVSDRTIFCITENDTLCEGEITPDSTIALSPLLDNVHSFEALNTSRRKSEFTSEDNAPADSAPYLINALTMDGKLFALGSYNVLYRNLEDFDVYLHESKSWELISENVSEFALSEYGTSYITKDGEGHYYGFDTKDGKGVDFEKVHLLSNCTEVSAGTNTVAFESQCEWSFYGNIFSVFQRDGYNVFSKTPFVWRK